MKTLEIPGGTCRLRERDEIKVRHRRMIESAAVAASSALVKLPSSVEELEQVKLQEFDLTRQEANALFELQDATIVACLIDWTLEDPIPTLDTVGDLDPDVYEGLAKATRELGAEVATATDFGAVDPSSPGFEGSPTAPSADSSSGSRAETESQSTDAPQTAGSSISSGAPSPD